MNSLICYRITNVPFHKCGQFLDAFSCGWLWKNNVVSPGGCQLKAHGPLEIEWHQGKGMKAGLFKQAGVGFHLEHRSAPVRSSERNSGWHNLTSVDTPLGWPLFSSPLLGIEFNSNLTESIKISSLLSSHFSTFAFLLLVRTFRPFSAGAL